MTMPATLPWYETNQRYLMEEITRVREALARHAARTSDERHNTVSDESAEYAAAGPETVPPALATLRATFALSPFESDLLLLCAGMELDAAFPSLCAAASGDLARPFPTFSLALAALPAPHWSALTPEAPLRRWRLIEVTLAGTLAFSALRIDERILHCLCGLHHLDERLVGMIEPAHTRDELAPSQHAMVKAIASAWSRDPSPDGLPIVQLNGADRETKLAIASATCVALGLRLSRIDAGTVPSSPSELEALARLWEREAALAAWALLVDCDDLDAADMSRTSAAVQLLARLRCPLFIASRERRQVRGRIVLSYEPQRPDPREQYTLWCNALDHAPGLNGHLDTLVSQFSLSAPVIQATARQTLAAGSDAGALPGMLWDACRMQARTHMRDLAQQIDPAASWDDLVLPDEQLRILREIAVHVRVRSRVYQDWGWAARGTRGLGISALFAGASGTGKTMAAEVLAGALRLDLYRIDLSQVVSKYIGETEKNLRRVFDAAEEGGAILLFDEADALFGKRSEVKDSHDRYANIEVGYLLQRMEAYRGLAILTTNMKDALDAAFLRRLRFVVHFTFPDAAQRAAIWQRIFPRETPTIGLRIEKLARLNVAGGNIRNIALNASFLAADAGEPVCMPHLLRAARGEYAKLERPLTEAEIGGWV
jgi:ATPase family associated with various cellular activities (AAA)